MMTMRKLTDSELAARLRQRNRVNSERRRERLALAGKVQLLAWIPTTLRRELDSIAAANNETVSDTVERLLRAGLSVTLAGTVDPLPAYRVTGGGQGQPAIDDDGAEAALERRARGEERTLTLEQWERRGDALGG